MFDFLKPHDKDYHSYSENYWIYTIFWAILIVAAIVFIALYG